MDIVLGFMFNWLCGLGLDVVLLVVCVIKVGEIDLVVVGGVESMFWVLFVMLKVGMLFFCNVEIYDMIIGWWFVNLFLKC